METVVFNKRSTAIIDLHERGYEVDFVITDGVVACVQDRSLIKAEDFEITEKYLFIDDCRLESNCLIFAVHIIDSDTKGILVASYHHSQNIS
jgi:hypothetical protein